MHDFDLDPEALAWARQKVERVIDRYHRLSEQAQTGAERARTVEDVITEMALAEKWRIRANLLRRDLIGGQGCVIAAFDERRPNIARVIPESDGYSDGEVWAS